LGVVLGIAAVACAGVLGAGSRALAQAGRAVVVDPNAAQIFARLPMGTPRTEGITVDPETGNLFVGTTAVGGMNSLLRINRLGVVTGNIAIGPAPILGLAFNARDSKVYLAAPGGAVQQPSFIQRVPADFGVNSRVETVAQVPVLEPAPGSTPNPTMMQPNPAPNGLTFRESDGTLFFSDSAQSVIFRVNDPTLAANTCTADSACVQLAFRDPLITAAGGAPPVGANGLAFSEDETRLFVANTGNDQIIQFALVGEDGRENPLPVASVLVQDINGADGLVRGPGNTLVVTANRADQIVIVDADTGRPLAELGEFLGVGGDGAPLGLSTPASVAVLDDTLFVTNLSAPSQDGPASPEGEITSFTISRISIPDAVRFR
jgi:DNA-binding beta-propeller fold protein YncE